MEEVLKELGLEENEIKIYLACLSLGPATIARISLRSNLPRSSTYLLINQLQQKGFVSSYSYGKKALITPTSPDKLIGLVEEKKLELQRLGTKLIKQLPELLSFYNSMPQKPKVLFYEGLEGIKNIFYETLKSSEILVLCSGYDRPLEKKLDVCLNEYFETVDKRKISTYEIIGQGLDVEPYVQKFSGKLHQIKAVGFKKGLEHIDKMIYGNKMAIVSFVYLNGVVIENKQVVDFEREMFCELWKNLK